MRANAVLENDGDLFGGFPGVSSSSTLGCLGAADSIVDNRTKTNRQERWRVAGPERQNLAFSAYPGAFSSPRFLLAGGWKGKRALSWRCPSIECSPYCASAVPESASPPQLPLFFLGPDL